MTALDSVGLRHGYADLSEARLHYVEAGDGPLVVLLHGFPEFWYSWRHQIRALAAAGFQVVAPDMRGYNLSSKPSGVSSYEPRRVAGDVRDLVEERGAARALLAGHDWGAAIAWLTAIAHPEVVERLAILNVPHPRRMLESLRRPGRQTARSWYIFSFQLPWLPEQLVRARDWRFVSGSSTTLGPVRSRRRISTATERPGRSRAPSPPRSTTTGPRCAGPLRARRAHCARSKPPRWSSGASATATSAPTWPNPAAPTYRT